MAAARGEDLSLKRRNVIKDISSLLDESIKILNEISNSLGWDVEKLKKEVAQCPYNKDHVMESRHLEKHLSKCQLRKLGIDGTCESSRFYYESSTTVISDLTDQNNTDVVLPTDMLWSRQTCEERLQDYNKTVKFAKSKRKIGKQSLDQDISGADQLSEGNEQQFKSKLEMLAEQRDYKRRRQSYRAKNVHITKRTPTDIMREIIENRMKVLEHDLHDINVTAISME